MRFRIEATPMHAKLEPGARFSRRDLSLGECLGHSVCRTAIRRISVEYTMLYVGEQGWILNIQPIEIIECRRTVTDRGEPIIWPSQG
jgi:hypothetical protein